MSWYVSLDIGASGGKMSLAKLENDKIVIKEIHRFKNGIIVKNKNKCWDFDMVFNEIIVGLKKIKKMSIDKVFLGIDTWAIDYALIDDQGQLIDKIYSYRDKRTANFFKKNEKSFNKADIYNQTGITLHEFNTLYQLYVQKIWEFKNLQKILLLPDYLVYLLTGEFVAESTNLATTQLFDIQTNQFSKTMLDYLQIDETKFGRIVKPGDYIGTIKSELLEKYNIPECQIIAVASHDTSSAIVAMPSLENEQIFISSGTWSLLGIELKKPIINKTSYLNNFTNQLGATGEITFLKNIIGMWIIQEVEKNLSNKFSISDLIHEAQKFSSFQFLMDCEDKRYISTDNMIYEIWKYFELTNQQLPYSIGQLVRCVFDSLALCYYDSIQLLQKTIEKTPTSIYIFGGGCQNKLVNQSLANLSKKIVYAGPVEATMIGNVVIQMIANKEISDLVEARKLIIDSFEVNKFLPDEENYQSVINKYNLVKEMRKK